MRSLDQVRSPKLSAQIQVAGYQYYAGFATDFVSDLLQILNVGPTDTVLDPWNGSGTTTLVAGQIGVPSIGIDLNPVMAVISKGRLQPEAERALAIAEAEKLLTPAPASHYARRDDPLLAWFNQGTVSRLRELTQRITRVHSHQPLSASQLSISDCHLVTAAFVTVRQLARPFLGSNPTWVKNARSKDELIGATWRTIASTFLSAVRDMAMTHQTSKVEPKFLCADSTRVAEDVRANVIVTSPPYCTRIDYAVATRLELSLLGVTAQKQVVLRRAMLGTTTVPNQKISGTGLLSATARDVLSQVTDHGSYASRTYYAKWLGQFMVKYEESMRALTEMAAPAARAAFVVQDSYFKDLHIDLARITTEVCTSLGWEGQARQDFFVPKTMAGINTPSRAYRSTFSATESMLTFTKKESDA